MKEETVALPPACNPDNMRKFITALRSGEFKQDTGRLRRVLSRNDDGDPNEYGYCCLGVATEVAFRNGVPENFFVRYDDDDDPDNPSGFDMDIWDDSTLTKPVREWLGIASHNPELTALDDASGLFPASATSWNDRLKAGFPKISDMFEAKYLPGDRQEEVTTEGSLIG